MEEPNILDSEPFFTFNLLDFKDSQIETLSEFCKEVFDIEKAFNNAGDLKYIKQFECVIENEYRNPSDDFVRYLLDKSGIYDGVKTAKVIETITQTSGAISIYDERWEARILDNNEIPVGENVKIVRYDSLIMFVERN